MAEKLQFSWLTWYLIESADLLRRLPTPQLGFLCGSLKPWTLCVPLSEIFSNFWIFEYFQLNFQHCIHSSSSTDIVGLIARLDSIVSQLFQYPMWLHHCNQAISSLSILSNYRLLLMMMSWNPTLGATRRLPQYLSCFVENSWNKFWSEPWVMWVHPGIWPAESWARWGWCRARLQVIAAVRNNIQPLRTAEGGNTRRHRGKSDVWYDNINTESIMLQPW